MDTVNIGVLKLDVEAKSQIINLFNILDTDKNGKLEQADFELAATHGTISRSAAREKFFHLRVPAPLAAATLFVVSFTIAYPRVVPARRAG